MTQVFLLKATSSPWAVPANFTVAGHTVEMVGNGGNTGIPAVQGTSSRGVGGGGGGAYIKLLYSSGTITPGTTTIPFAIGGPGTGSDPTTFWEGTTITNSYAVHNGADTTSFSGATGGASTLGQFGTPAITYTNPIGSAGGNGGNAQSGAVGGGGGGGGAGGPNGAGGNGFTATSTFGGGGGGANNGTTGNAPGQAGGTGSSGTGGSAGNPGGNGTGNSGGGGSNTVSTAVATTGGNGGSGTDFDGTHGLGGGGGASGSNSGNVVAANKGGSGGSFGGGGGGVGSIRGTVGTSAKGIGGDGLIIITDFPPATFFGFQQLDRILPPKNIVGLKVRYPFIALAPFIPWYEALSEPVRIKPGQRAERQKDFFAEPFGLTQKEQVTESRWHQPYSDPVRRKGITVALIASGFIGPVVPPPTPIFPDSWLRPLSEPVRVKPDIGAPGKVRYPFIAVVPHIGWYEPLNEPVRPKTLAAANQTFQFFVAPSGEVTTADKWYKQFNDPVRRVATATRSEQLSIDTDPVVSFGWFGNLSDPSRPKSSVAGQSYQFFVAPSGEIITADKWFAQFRDPVRRIATPTRYEQIIIDTDPIVSFGWFGNLSDPSRRVATATRHEQPSWSLFPDNVTYGWITPWLDLIRRVPPTRYEQPSWSLPGEVSTVDKWFKSFAEPVRRIATATRYEQPSWALFPDNVTYSWLTPWPDLIRRTATATRYEQQSWSLFVEPVVVTFGWYENLSDPTRLKPDIGAASRIRYQFVASSARMSWFSRLSEPTLPKGPRVALQPSFSFAPLPVAPFSWFASYTDPTRRIGIRTALEPYFSFGPFPIPAPVNYVASYYPDQIPRGPRSPGLGVRYPFIAVVVRMDWFSPLADPTRRVRTASPSTQVQPPFPITPSFAWYAPWREPTPPKRRNPFFQPFIFTSTPPIIPSYGWYGNLSNPRWNKPKVWEGQYQAWNPATINFSYLATMSAYERRDVMSAVLYAFSPPVRAYVDIITKDPKYRGNLTVIGNAPEPSILASIVTPQTIPATGTPVAAVRARVAIIVS
jgi:hypothetical protein